MGHQINVAFRALSLFLSKCPPGSLHLYPQVLAHEVGREVALGQMGKLSHTCLVRIKCVNFNPPSQASCHETDDVTIVSGQKAVKTKQPPKHWRLI